MGAPCSRLFVAQPAARDLTRFRNSPNTRSRFFLRVLLSANDRRNTRRETRAYIYIRNDVTRSVHIRRVYPHIVIPMYPLRAQALVLVFDETTIDYEITRQVFRRYRCEEYSENQLGTRFLRTSACADVENTIWRTAACAVFCGQFKKKTTSEYYKKNCFSFRLAAGHTYYNIIYKTTWFNV